MEHTHAALVFDSPLSFKLRRQFPRVEWLLRREALFFTGHVILAHFAKVTLEQVAIDQRIAVVERQRQPAIRFGELMQHRQDGVRLGQPLQHSVTNHQIVSIGQQFGQRLPGCLDEGRRLSGLGEALTSAFEHRFGRFGQCHLMTALGQPQRHVTQASADVQHAQWSFG
ncbi:hypothetical protein PS634_05491 [Pseudomonas fluorescens]|nr:hypothetical protein PS634_05491 [Pseudomonas fluorescens]